MFKIANILTGFNLLSGVISIIFAFTGRLEWAVLAIIIGAVFDFLDGFIARLLKQQGELGKQLDSLADMVTFGVAPGIIVFILLILAEAQIILLDSGNSIENIWVVGTFGDNVHYWLASFLNSLAFNDSSFYSPIFNGKYLLIPFIGLLIPFFSMFRLAKFNLDTRQSMGFIGLPTPANSLFFASFALLIWDGFGEESWKFSLSLALIQLKVLIPLVVLFSLLLVAEIPLFSLKFSKFGWKGNEIKFIFLGLSVILFILLFVWAIPLIIVLYIILSIINNRISTEIK